ncbi:tachylectin-related carbohydrate-binding protein [Streptomyces sp. CRN 30]|uniref:tachylectin-related carbohydrate-binding protein n=1 Tax=Streptomyces sp. CRN 30 TaxID=3075613 RepID=UPI002A7F66E2|nr:tachylectin-related carbohydrate-binding protein [Streptomyces sp. CRN 30]
MRPLSRGRLSRRVIAITTAAAALPIAMTTTAGTAQAADDITCSSSGALYSVTTAGSLLRRNVSDPAGATGALPEASTIDTGWDQYPRVLTANGATFYGIKSDGLYFSHRDSSTSTWDVHHRKISDSYSSYRLDAGRNKITADRGGNLWFVDGDGDLRYAHYTSSSDTWTADSNKKIASGWGRYSFIVATELGVVYGVDSATGNLTRSRYDFTSQRWIEQHRTVSWADWRDTEDLTSFGGDTILRVKPNGEVRQYRFREDAGDFDPYNVLLGSGSWWSGYTSVTGAPDACRLTASHTPASPTIAYESFTPNSVLQPASGEIEYAYTDNIGHLVHGRQTDPSDFNSVQWTTVSGNEGFSGQPQLAEQPDGRTALTAQNVTSEIWWRRHAASSPDWGDWVNLAGAMAERPVTAKTADGVLAQFTVDADGKPWYRMQQRANVDFMGWLPLTGEGFSGPLTAVTVRNGIQLFGTDESGTLRTATFSNGAVGAWTTLGDQVITGTPSVVVYPGYRLGVFARDTAGHIISLAQATEGAAFPAAWSQVTDKTFAGSPSVVISPLTGITEIVARAEDGYTYNTGEQTQGSGTWRTWQQLNWDTAATDPTAFLYTNASGPTWAYTFRTGSNQTRVYEAGATGAAARSAGGAKPAPTFTAHELPAPPAE